MDIEVDYLTKIKVNLFLHVTGKKTNGYHTLESLVAFAHYGDRLTIKENFSPTGEGLLISCVGPFASELIGKKNLLHKAYNLMQARYDIKQKFHITLEKNIPIGAGLGGGSGDVAVFLKAINLLCGLSLSQEELVSLSIALGSDVAVCLYERASMVSGTGDAIFPLSTFPFTPIVFINPMQSISTPEAYGSLTSPYCDHQNVTPLHFLDICSLVSFLKKTHNAFLPYACSQVPEISENIAALRAMPGCVLSGMSGSGSTCFGLFDTVENAEKSSVFLKKNYPHYWICASYLS